MLRPAQRRLILLSAAFALSFLSCGREVTGPDNGINFGNRVASLALAPQMPSLMSVLDGAGDAVPFDRVRVLLRNADGSVAKDTTVDFPPGADSVALQVQLPLPLTAPDSGLPLALTMSYVNAAGDTVFRGGPNPIVARPIGRPGANAPVVIPITYEGPGKDATSVVIAPDSGSAVAGTTRTFTATAFASGTPISNTPFLFYTLDSARAQVNAASGLVTWLPVRGTARIVAALPNGFRADTATFSISLPASKLTLQAGGSQTGAINATLSDTIVVRTLASDDVPVSGVPVTFAVATGGGSVATINAVSDSLGRARAVWTLGGTLGAQSITATSAGLTGSPLTITATAVAGTPARLDITAQPSTGTAGAALTPAITVTARDAFGNVATSFTGNVTLAALGANPPPVAGTLTRAAVGGVATFNDVSVNLATAIQLEASSGALTPDTTAAITIGAAAAARLEFVQEPLGAAAGADFTPAVTVRAVDAFGNPATTFTGNVAMSLDAPVGVSLLGTTPRAALAGLATFSNLAVRQAGTGYRLIASSAGLVSDTSASFGITALAPTVLTALGGNGQTGAAGTALPDSIVARVTDVWLNPIAGASVSVSVVSGGGSVSNTTLVSDSTGRVALRWTLGTFVGAQQIALTLPGVPTSTVAFDATATVGAPAQVVITNSPTTGTAGAGLSLIAEVQDALGNRITTYTGQLTLALDANPTGAALGGTVLVNAMGGVATFAGWNITKAASGYTLRVTATADSIVSAPSAPFSITAAAAAQFDIVAGNNQTVVAGSAFPQPLQVRVRDIFGNPKIGEPTTWSENGVVTLGSVGVILTDSTGVATNTATAGTAVGAQGAGPSVTTPGVGSVLIFEHTVTASTPTEIVFIQQPSTVTAGQPFPPTLFLEARDAFGNRVATYTDSIRITVDSGPAGGSVLFGGFQPFLNGGGPAFGQFAGLEIEKAGTYRLRAITGTGLTGVSAPIVVVPDLSALGLTAVSGMNDTGVVNQPFGAPLRVLVQDQYSNPVPGISVVWADQGGGATLSADTVLTDANGIAEVLATHPSTPVSLSGISAQIVGIPGTRNFSYTTVAAAATQLVVTQQPPNPVQAGQGFTVVVQARDAFGNLNTSYADSATIVILNGSVGATLSGVTKRQMVGGVATFSGLSIDKSGTFELAISAPGLTTAVTSSFGVTAGTPAILTKASVSNDAQTAVVGDTLLPFRVRVTDASLNPVSGVAVRWSPSVGGGSFVSDTTLTDANGEAQGVFVAPTLAGGIVVTAEVTGLAGSPQTFTATVTAGAAARIFVITNPSGSTPAGTPLTDFVAQVVDSFGNPTSFSDSLRLSLDAAPVGGTILAGDTVAVVIGSTATFSGVTLGTAGLYSFAVNGTGLVGDIPPSILVQPGAADSLAIVSGDKQTMGVTDTTAQELVVVVRDAYGNAVAGESVAFDVAGGAVSVTAPSTTTDASGEARTRVVAGSSTGAFSIRALAGLGPDSAIFTGTVVAGAASLAEELTAPTNGTAGVAMAPFSYVVKDAFGNVATGYNGTAYVVVDTATANDPTPVVTGGDTVAVVNGVATWSALTITSAGNFRIIAEFGPGIGSVVSAPFTIAPAAPALLAKAGGDGESGQVGTVLPIPLAVRITDAFSNGVAGVNVNFNTISGFATPSQSTVATDATGLASVTVSLDSIAGPVLIGAFAAGLTPDSLVFSLTALSGAPASFTVLAGDSQTVAAGAAAADTIRVRLTDAFGNPVAGTNVEFNSFDGVTFSPAVVVTDSNGIVSTIAIAPTSVGVKNFAATRSPAPDRFLSMTVVAAPASEAVISAAPLGGSAGQVLDAVAVQLTDAFGNNAAAATDSVFLEIAEGPVGGTVGGVTRVAATAGVATFSSLTLTTSGTYRFRVFGPGIIADTSDAFTVDPDTAAFVAYVSGDAQSMAVTATATDSLVVRVTDTYGNAVPGTPISWGVSVGTALVSSASVLTDSNGHSKIALTASQFAESGTVTAVNAGLTGSPVSFTYTVTAGAAAQLEFLTPPNSTTAGNTQFIQVRALDAFGNVASSFGGSISLAVDTGPPSPVVTGTLTVAASGGLANFNNIAINTAGTYRLRASAAGVADTVTGLFTILTDAPAALSIVAGDSQSVTAGTIAPLPLRVRLTDAYGNPVAGEIIQWTESNGPVSVGFTSTTTDAAGEATVGVQSQGPAGNFGVFAINTTANDTVLFVGTVIPDTPSGIAVVSGGGQTIPAGSTAPDSIRVQVQDAWGNAVPGISVTFATSDDLTFSDTTVITDSLGTAATRVTAGPTVGTKTLTAFAVPASPANVTIDVIAAAASSATITAAPTTGVAGVVLAPITVQLKDAFGNDATAATDSVFLEIADGPVGATLSGLTGLAASGGVVDFSSISTTTAGVYRFRVFGTGIAADTTGNITVAPDTAAFLNAISGNAQTMAPTATAADSLVVRVTDTYGNPVPNTPVSWSVAPGTAVPSSSSVFTDADGYAKITLTASSVAESGTVTASNAVLSGSPVAFTYTTEAGAPSLLEFTGQPTTAPAGQPQFVTVRATDAFGNVATGFTGTITLSVDSGPANPVVTGTLALAASGGIASFSNIAFQTAGSYRLRASAPGVADTVGDVFEVTPDAPAQLAIVSGDLQTVTAGTSAAAPLRVRLTDQFGNVAPGYTVDFSVTNGDVAVGALTVTTDATGEAETSLLSNGLAGAYSVRAVNVAANDTVLFTGSVTAAAAWAFSTIGGDLQTMGAGVAAADSLVVQLLDTFGNGVPNATVVLTGTGGLTFSSDTVITDATGRLRVQVIGGGTTGLQTVTLASPPAVSLNVSFTVVPGPAVALDIAAEPTAGAAGDFLLPAVAARAIDQFGNVVLLPGRSITVSLDSSATVGPLTGTLTVATDSVVTGAALFEDLTLETAGAYRLVVTSPGLAPDTTTLFTIGAAAPDTLLLLDGDAQTVSAGGVLANPLRVRLVDAFGNGVPGRSVSWLITGGAAFVDSSETTTDANGVAAMTISGAVSVGTVTVQAQGPAGAPVDFTVSVQPGAAVQLSVVTQPFTATAGGTMSPVEVEARDAYFNRVTGFTDSVFVAFEQSPGGATLGGTARVSAVAGVATFSDLSLPIAGTYRFRFSSNAAVADTTSDAFTITAGAPDSVGVLDGNNQVLAIGAVFDTLRVFAADAFGNRAPGAVVQWSVSSSFDSLYAEGVTDSQGIARAVVRARTGAGTNGVMVFADGLAGSPTGFNLTITAGPAVELFVGAAPDTVVTQTTGAAWVIAARDSVGNVVIPFNGNVTVTVNDGPGGISGVTTVVADSGVAVFDSLSLDAVGSYTLEFSTSGLPSVLRSTYAKPGPAFSIAAVTGASQSGFVGLPLDTALRVVVRDANSNPVPGDTVVFAVQAGSGGGLVDGAETDTVITDANGQAVTSFVPGATIGVQTVRATASNAAFVDFTATVSEQVGNRIWTGDVSSAWLDAGNWKFGAVPTATDSVYIPAGRPHQPALSGPNSIARLTVDSGATLTTNNFLLTISGAVSVPSVLAIPPSSEGGFVLTSVRTDLVATGAFPRTYIGNGKWTVAGTFSAGELRLSDGAEFVVPTGTTANVATLYTFTNATFSMADGGELNVAGQVALSGGSTAGKLTGGTLRVGGNFLVDSSSAFAADSAHLTILNGVTTQFVNFLFTADTNLSDTCANACFGRLVANKAPLDGGVVFQSSVKARGGFDLNVGSIDASGVTLIAGDTSTFSSASTVIRKLATRGGFDLGSAVTLDSITFWGTGTLVSVDSVPGVVFGQYQLANTYAADLRVDGTLEVSGPGARVVGDLTTVGGGQLLMEQADDSLQVDGNVVFNGLAGTVSQGTLRVRGNVSVGSTTGLSAWQTHLTEFFGPANQTVTFSDPGNSAFGRVRLAKSGGVVTSASITYLNGSLLSADTTQTWTGAGWSTRLVVRGAQIGGLSLENQPLVLEGAEPADTLRNLRFRTFDAGLTQLTVQRGSGTVQLVSPVFDTVAASPQYLAAVETDVGNGDTLTVVVVDPRPLIHNGAITTSNGAKILGWQAFELLTWNNGSTDGNWFNPANWAQGFAPTAQDSVAIPDGVQPPTISAPATVRVLVSTSTTPIQLNDVLTVRERLNLSAVEDTTIVCGPAGSLRLDGSSAPIAVSGRVACGITVGAVGAFASADLQTDSLLIDAGGEYYAGQYRTRVVGNLRVTDGALRMDDGASEVVVGGLAQFAAATGTPTLTAGTLSIDGSFEQIGEPDAFQPAGTHLTRFTGGTDVNISFQNPDSTDAGSYFHNVEIGTDAAPLVLGSDVFARGTATQGLGNMTFVTAPAAPVRTFHSVGASVSNAAFDNVRWVVDSASTATITGVAFLQLAGDGTQLRLRSTGGTMSLANVAFDATSLVAGDVYLAAEDPNGATDGVFTIALSGITPSFHSGRIALTGVTIAGWDENPTFVWTGALDGQTWEAAGNWSDGVVPGAADSVTIPVAATGNIFAIGAKTIGALVHLSPDATLEISDGDFTVTGTYNTGSNPVNCTAAQVILANPTATTSDFATTGFCSVSINDGTYRVAANSAVQNLTVAGDATLDLDGQTLVADLSFAIQDSAAVIMDQATDVLRTNGNGRFEGRGSFGLLTAGSIEVAGDFTRGGSPASFASTGTQRVVLGDSTTGIPQNRNLAFSAGDFSYFNNLYVANHNYRILDGIRVQGGLRMRANVSLDSGVVVADSGLYMGIGSGMNVRRLAVRGNFLPTSNFSADTVDLYGPIGVAPFQQVPAVTGGYKRLRVYGTARVLGTGPQTVTVHEAIDVIAGVLEVRSGGESPGNINLVADSADLIVSGSAIFGMRTLGTVSFDSVHFGGASTTGWLRAGTLRVGKALVQTAGDSPSAFRPDSALTVELLDSVVVSLATPDSSRFQNLKLGEGSTVRLLSDIAVDGTLSRETFGSVNTIVESDVLSAAPGRLITVNGGMDFSSGAVTTFFRNVRLRLVDDFNAAGGSYSFSRITFTEMDSASTYLDLTAFENYTVIPDYVSFSTPVTTGRYFEIPATTTLAFQNSFPTVGCIGSPEGCIGPRFEPGSTELNAFTGSIAGNWSDSTNWSLGHPPRSYENVLIDNNSPFLDAGPVHYARNLTVTGAGSVFTDPGAVLEIRGDFTNQREWFGAAGATMRFRRSADSGPTTIDAGGLNIDDLLVVIDSNLTPGADSVVLVSPLQIGSNGNPSVLRINAGVLDLNGHEIDVDSLVTSGTGAIRMATAADRIRVNVLARFEGGSTEGRLTDGELIVMDALSQAANASAYAASGAHKTTVWGNGSLTFANPGATDSRVALLRQVGAGVVTLGSDVVVTGDVYLDDGAVTYLGGATNRELRVPGISTVGSGIATFDNVRLKVVDGSNVSLSVQPVTFQNMDPSVDFLTFDRSGGTISIPNIIFNSTPSAPARYIVAIDTVSNGDPLQIFLDQTQPGAHNNLITAVGDANIQGWDAFAQYVFTGAVSGSVFDPANWDVGAVPSAISSVRMGGSAVRVAEINSNVQYRTLIVDPGNDVSIDATVTIGAGFYPTMTTFCGLNGEIVMQPVIALGQYGGNGRFCKVRIAAGDVSVAGDSWMERVTVENGGRLIPGSSTGPAALTIIDSMVVRSGGSVIINNDVGTDTLFISKRTRFEPGSTGTFGAGTVVLSEDAILDGTVTAGILSHVVLGSNFSPLTRSLRITNAGTQFDSLTVGPGTVTVDGSLRVNRFLGQVADVNSTLTGDSVLVGRQAQQDGVLRLADSSRVSPDVVVLAGELQGSGTFQPDTVVFAGRFAGQQDIPARNSAEVQIPYRHVRVTGDARMGGALGSQSYRILNGITVAERLSINSFGDSVIVDVDGTVHVTKEMVVTGDSTRLRVDNMLVTAPPGFAFYLRDAGVLEVQQNFEGRITEGNQVQTVFDSTSTVRMLGANGLLDMNGLNNTSNTFGRLEFVGNTSTSMSGVLFARQLGRRSGSSGAITLRGFFAGSGWNVPIVTYGLDFPAGGGNLLLSNVSLQVRGETFAASNYVFNDARFADMDPDLVFLFHDVKGTDTVTYSNIFFDSPVSATGRYFANSANFGDGARVAVNFVNASPAVDCLVGVCGEGDEAPTGGSVAVATFVGGSDTTWTNPANWSGGVVPNAETEVTIPAGNAVSLGTSAQVKSLTVQTGAQLWINNNQTLTVWGDLTADGPILNPSATVAMRHVSGGSSLKAPTGVAPRLQILAGLGGLEDTVRLTGNVLKTDPNNNRGTQVFAGVLDIGQYTLADSGSFLTDGTGRLKMQHPNGVVRVKWNLRFLGGNTENLLTDGTMELRGYFQQDSVNSRKSFVATGNHLVRFLGPNTNDLEMVSSSPTESRFANIDIDKPVSGTVDLFVDSVFVQNLVGLNGGMTIDGGSFIVLGNISNIVFDSPNVADEIVMGGDGIMELRGVNPATCDGFQFKVSFYKSLFRPSACHTTWVADSSPTTEQLNAVQYVGDSTVVAVGNNGVVLRKVGGGAWTQLTSGTTENLLGIATNFGGGATNEFWVVGTNGTVISFAAFATTGTTIASGTTTTLRGAHWEGGSLGGLYVVGDGGYIGLRNSGNWVSQTSGTSEDLYGVGQVFGQGIVAYGGNGVMRIVTGSSGIWGSVASPTTNTLRSVWSGVVENWYVGDQGTFVRKGPVFDTTLTVVASVPPVSTQLNGVGGQDDKYFHAVGLGGTILRRELGQWTPITSGTSADLYGMAVNRRTNLADAYAVGAGGVILRADLGWW